MTRFWTTAEDNLLRKQWGKPISEIMVGERSRGAIEKRARKLGLKRAVVIKEKAVKQFKPIVHAPTEGKGVYLVDIRPKQCHWPIAGQLYCGASCSKFYKYCKTHEKMLTKRQQ